LRVFMLQRESSLSPLTTNIIHGPFKSLLKGVYSSSLFPASEFSAKQQK
jgi:hypothetical protein